MPSLLGLLGLVLVIVGVLVCCHLIAGSLLFGIVVIVVGLICMGAGGHFGSWPRGRV